MKSVIKNARHASGYVDRGQKHGNLPRSIRSEELKTFSMCSAVAFLAISTSCSSLTPREVPKDHPKLVSLRHTVEEMAQKSLRVEESHGRGPITISYRASISPRISNGYNMLSDELSGIGCPVYLSVVCAAETLDEAPVAVVDEAVLCANNQMLTSSEVLTWRGGKWVSSKEMSLTILRSKDPEMARMVEESAKSITGSPEK